MSGPCRCFKFRGSVFIRPVDLSVAQYSPDPTPTRPWRFVGNSSKLDVDITTTTDRVKDYTQCCGGDICYREEIDQLKITLDSTCLNPDVAALALRGDSVGITAGPKTKNFASIRRGDVLPLGPYINAATLLVPGLTLGTDFSVVGQAIQIAAAAPNVPASGGLTNVEITWTQTKDAARVEMAGSCISKEVELMFQANNCLDATDGGIEQLLYRVSLSGTPKLELLSENAGVFSLSGTLLRDPRILNGSQFGTLTF